MKKFSPCVGVFLLAGFVCFGLGKTVAEYIAEAQTNLNLNDLEKAITTMEQAVKEYPDSSIVYTQMGLLYGEQVQGMKDFSKILQLFTKTFAMWDKALLLDPNNFEARFYRGTWGVSVPEFAGQTEKGIHDLEFIAIVIEQSGDPALQDYLIQAYQYLGIGYQKLMAIQKAKEFYTLVIKAASGSEFAKQAQDNLTRIDQFEQWQAEHGKKTQPDSPQILQLKQKLEQEPDNPGFLLALGRAYANAERYQEAVIYLQEAAQIDSTNVDVYKLLALSLQNLVGEEYDARISLDTDFRTNLAFALMFVLDRAVALAPDDIELRLWRGIASVEMPFFVGRLEQGIDDLYMVIQSSIPADDKAEALYWLGAAYQKKSMTYWIETVTQYSNSDAAQMVFNRINPQVGRADLSEYKKPILVIDFILGFRDELAPQTAVWIEDKDGNFVKTIYVSGFSGHAKEKQVNLPMWSHSSEYVDVDVVPAATVDLSHHIYIWDLKDMSGKKVKSGEYTVFVEVSYWPSMQYQRVSAAVRIGKKEKKTVVEQGNLIPYLEVKYIIK